VTARRPAFPRGRESGDGITLSGCSYFPETHDYASPGQYHVVVTTTFSNGLQLVATETVTVS